MGKYTENKIAGYWLYYTMLCLNEGVIHVHANKDKPIERGSAKIWVHSDGTSTVAEYGSVGTQDMNIIQEWISKNIDIIEDKWKSNNMGGDFKRIK